jgi:hypothetical protein
MSELSERDFRRRGVLYACEWTDKVWRTIRELSRGLRLEDNGRAEGGAGGHPTRNGPGLRNAPLLTSPRSGWRKKPGLARESGAIPGRLIYASAIVGTKENLSARQDDPLWDIPGRQFRIFVA